MWQGSKRQRIWQHNGYSGRVAMMQSNLRAIASSDSTTPEAKKLAWKMLDEANKLRELVKERIDP